MPSDSETLTRHLELCDRDVVDVGCGAGDFACAMSERGARVTAIEISEQQLAPARQRIQDERREMTLAVGRAEALPLADRSQDIVVFMRSLHHVETQRMGDALREARRVLRPGGAVWVVEPLPEGDFFELVSLVEDETEVRAAARATIEAAAEYGLRHELSERYEVVRGYADLGELVSHMVGVDPARAPLLERHRDQLARRFAAGGEPDGGDGGRRFTLPHRADLLRAHVSDH